MYAFVECRSRLLDREKKKKKNEIHTSHTSVTDERFFFFFFTPYILNVYQRQWTVCIVWNRLPVVMWGNLITSKDRECHELNGMVLFPFALRLLRSSCMVCISVLNINFTHFLVLTPVTIDHRFYQWTLLFHLNDTRRRWKKK